MASFSKANALLKGEKNIKVCRGNCGRRIRAKDHMIVRSYGTYTWRDAKTQEEVSKWGPRYIHFNETCLKNYDTVASENYYAPQEKFDFGRVDLDENSQHKLSEADIRFLKDIGVQINGNYKTPLISTLCFRPILVEF